VSGKNLSDFPLPDGNNEREAMKLILSTRPLLNAHLERWSKRVMEVLGRRGVAAVEAARLSHELFIATFGVKRTFL
jgi:hypothetical protein